MKHLKNSNNKGGLLNNIENSICVGAGLLALDVIVNGSPATPARLCAGGTCGNVISNLAFLGWKSKPIARLQDNSATERLLEDLNQFSVETSLISKSEDGSTPIIIHRILKDENGNPRHKFEFRVPDTGEWLPRYKPVLKKSVSNLVNIQPKANVFFFDRVSPSILDLAKHYKREGALIVFEPSSLKADNKTFMNMIEVSNIVKFSNERIGNFDEFFPEPVADLEIETLGKDGLRYRFKRSPDKNWKIVEPFLLDDIVDSGGAGDWCTSGIINELGESGIESFNVKDEEEIQKALNIGQALGALNCMFFGARGLAYNISRDSLNEYLETIFNRSNLNIEANQSSTKMVTIDKFRFESII